MNHLWKFEQKGHIISTSRSLTLDPPTFNNKSENKVMKCLELLTTVLVDVLGLVKIKRYRGFAWLAKRCMGNPKLTCVLTYLPIRVKLKGVFGTILN